MSRSDAESAAPDSSPLMAQYRRIRERHADAVLFFRLGDFYEMFEKDAGEVSALLDLTLTKRNGVPMCGIPYHAASGYIARLLAAGKKIAVCEQVTSPGAGKGLLEREVVEILTPGTVTDENLLDRGENNYIIAVTRVGDRMAIAHADLSTSEFGAAAVPASLSAEWLGKALLRLAPKEAVVQESLYEEDGAVRRLLEEREGLLINRYPDWAFTLSSCRTRLEKHFGVANLKAFGLGEDAPEIAAAGALLEYLEETSKRSLGHFRGLSVEKEAGFLHMDEAAQRNLELLSNLQDGSRRYTLLETLDQTRTAAGARLLRRRILSPLVDGEEIRRRLDRVGEFHGDQVALSRVREILAKVPDLERLASRVALERANAKDLLAIGSALDQILRLADLLDARAPTAPVMDPVREQAAAVGELGALIRRTVAEEPSALLTEGNLIRRGADAELDRLHGVKENARAVLEKYAEEERARTGISSLKIRYNRLIGYYFEVTKSNLALVPPDFIRRQSLLGGERFATERLSVLESEINGASERIVELERGLFLAVRARVKERVDLLLALARAAAEIDFHQSLAFAATVHGYVKPELCDDTRLLLRDARHPVVEAHLPGGAFVPNSLELPADGPRFIVLTGPNMAGKSTFLRQTALVVVMAQMGSFVPAAEARIGWVDALFCRVGATDNLARGESTFLVEMSETARILRAATDRSLLIMDEIGRGTSTRDGLSIAWAVCEHVLARIRARTLFATHFHELTSLRDPDVRNLSMEVLESGGEVVFLKRVRDGRSDHAYGIHVAKLAGIPREILVRASEILRELEAEKPPARVPTRPLERVPTRPLERVPTQPPAAAEAGGGQPSLFRAAELVAREIQGTDPDGITPREALARLARWKRELDGAEEGR